MRLALILPANVLHAPYLNYYTEILDKTKVQYDIINWNKLNLKEDIINAYTFNFKCGYKSNTLSKIVGYYLFSKFVKRILCKEKYDKLIVFIPQFALFLSDILSKEYKQKFILDIRDYGKANRYIKRLESIINNSEFTVISSAGYKKWLPLKYNYVISHNTLFTDYNAIDERDKFDLRNKTEIIISNIGVIRNYHENCKAIDSFKQSTKFKLRYIGKGICEEDLKKYCNNNNIDNVSFHGKYSKNEELRFYQQSDIINLIVPMNSVGNNSAMANRFYNACISRCPLIVNKGSYMAEIVKSYNLGMAMDIDNDNMIEEVSKYINNFDYDKFIKGCKVFLSKIENEQKIFCEKVMKFI
ncbi:glycosyltransferase [Clostridium frigoris]|uniref:Glycosyltransferase n=1 Tax=Clostridium frigoris TaxID=205327 RepID=A0ABS6BVI0_9CLOT|nr:glycosyltransferase [Clostridium frigoris]MBU3159853.1 glycosyltransferase [Clostridium frigoris]